MTAPISPGGLQPGDPIGPFQIVRRIGAGGMGVVYLAETSDGVKAALKVIRPEFASEPTFRRRFGREVQAARRVQSPVTAAVIDADPDAGLPWVAFEYVEGPNLEDVVATTRPRLSAAIGILTGIAEALSAIHAVGIVHRDLKPSNVLCPPDGVKVIDFGIAAAVEATSLTGTGGLIGTPAWLAPEQVLGTPVTPAVDVFAWGCIAVYVTTGHLTFGGDESSPAAMLYQVVNVEPNLAGVPEQLVGLVAACLAKRPEDRPTVRDLLRQLLPAGPHRAEPEVVVPPRPIDPVTPPSPQPRWRGRNARLAGGVAALVVVAVVVLVVLARGEAPAHVPRADRGSTTTTGPPASSTATAVNPLRMILPPAAVAPAVDECQMQLLFGADGSVGPLTCPNGDLNVLAWTQVAMGRPTVMTLGPFASPSQVTNAICADLKSGNTTNPIEQSAYDLASKYYGWNFGVDPSGVILGGCI